MRVGARVGGAARGLPRCPGAQVPMRNRFSAARNALLARGWHARRGASAAAVRDMLLLGTPFALPK